MVAGGPGLPPPMQIKLFPIGKPRSLRDRFTTAEKVTFISAASIRKKEHPRRLALAEFSEYRHVSSGQQDLPAVFRLPGALALQAKSFVRFGTDVKDIPIEQEIASFDECDLALSRHTVKKELEDQGFVPTAGGEKCPQFIVRIRVDGRRRKDISARTDFAAPLLLFTKKVLTASITL